MLSFRDFDSSMIVIAPEAFALLDQWQTDEEGAAGEILFVPFFAFHPDAALQGFDNAGRDRKPQACTAALEVRAARRVKLHLSQLI